MENYYNKSFEEVRRLFGDVHLIFIDPVDKHRNVAAALRLENFNLFKVASKLFLRKPSKVFFYPPKPTPFKPKKLRKILVERQTDILFLKFACLERVPDILWGQMYKTQRVIQNFLEKSEFKVLRSKSWSDEKKFNVLVFELENKSLKNVKKHYGPPVASKEEEKFVSKYISNPKTVSGPYIENGRWVVLVKRKQTDAKALLKEKLKSSGRDIGVASRILKAIEKGFKILVNQEILDFYRKNPSFAVFLTEFLRGKPIWLEQSYSG
ncbi:hypothetical protein DRO26_04355 [Candidatus Bathyarchaeota archaeon]|nr:MAG: hypothetical protein DRO26_04355 [Candidatus Bathyarchaeota archaeon]